ncbi:tetratricopeptide repeat protein [Flavobacterium sp. 3HN19-14]|uniref:tetratricopeptide repeat protein n=1 Tax=Flavobacterium sp. 3HN19-14 TaxID=3448133 RepID=UPI003EE16147
MFKKLAAFFLLFTFTIASGQTASATDSLKNALENYNRQKTKSGRKGFSIADSTKVNLLNSLSFRYFMSDSKQAIAYSNESLALAKKINYKDGIAYAYIAQAQINDFKGNYQQAVDYTKMSIAIHVENKNKKALADEYSQLGIIYSEMGNYPEAMKFSLIALKMYEKEKNTLFIIKAYSNIAIIYKQQKKYKEALATNATAMKIIQKVKNTESNYFGCYIQNEIGEINLRQGKYDNALKILLPALKASGKFTDDYLNANICIAIANSYSALKNYHQAAGFYFKAMAALRKIGDVAGEANCIINIGFSNFKQGFTAKAIEETKKGLQLAQSTGYLEWQRNAYENLAEMYGSTKNYKLAYENHIQFKKLNDSLFNKEKDKKITEFRLSYEFDKNRNTSNQSRKKRMRNCKWKPKNSAIPNMHSWQD